MGLQEKIEALSATQKLILADCLSAMPKHKRNETRAQKESRLSAFEHDLLPVRRDRNNWKLNRVGDIKWIQDRSGIYTYINWDVKIDSVRIDIMTEAETAPLQSFTGDADNVRKAVMQWLAKRVIKVGCGISLEHAAYIGAELERCDTERIDYVQD